MRLFICTIVKKYHALCVTAMRIKLSGNMFRNLLKFNAITIYKPYMYHNLTLSINSNLPSQPKSSVFRIEKFSSILSGYGFKPGQINRIFNSPDSIMALNENELLSNLTYWLKFGVSDKLLTSLCAYPELLTLNPDFLHFRKQQLMSIFSKKDINKLLVTCPSVFLDDYTNVYEKVQYMVHVMGCEQKSIVKSCALQFDLDHIKCRHMFITRAGKFAVHKKSAKSKNPPLDKIFCRNIQTYLKLTKLTEEEFLAFCRCFKEEILELQEDEESDDEQ